MACQEAMILVIWFIAQYRTANEYLIFGSCIDVKTIDEEDESAHSSCRKLHCHVSYAVCARTRASLRCETC